MFYCEECRKNRNYPESISKSYGKCELCGEIVRCNDVPSSKLPTEMKKNTLKGGENFLYDAQLAIQITQEGIKILDNGLYELHKSEIDDIAFKLLQKRLGLKFKRELTSEEKLKIIEKPEFKVYIDDAILIFKKKFNSLNNKKYPIIDVPSSGKKEWMGGAYSLCFVYSKYKGNFVLRGYAKEVEEYLRKNYTHYFYNITLWHQGFSRNIWKFWKDNVGIFEPDKHKSKYHKRNYKFSIRYYSDILAENSDNKEIILKRLPKRWIPEFDVF